ncbi:hypothetical protein V2J09_012369 [Rumex salicifolius]
MSKTLPYTLKDVHDDNGEFRVMMPGDSSERIMDIETSDLQTRRTASLGRQRSISSSLRTRSFSLSGRLYTHLNEDENLQVEIGDRELSSNRSSECGSRRFSLNLAAESGVVVPIPEDFLLQSSVQNAGNPIEPPPFQNVSPLPTDRMLPSDGKRQEDLKQLPPWLEYVSCMIYLAVFGILGVLTRYLLQKLFGPGVIDVTGDGSILYLDLPSNMIGSFLMGWFGVVFKADISSVSNQLAIGLSTGYLGSLTTFSGWNQKMLDLSVKGHWTFAILGFLQGLFLAGFSIILGIDSAQGIRWLYQRFRKTSDSNQCSFQVNTIWRHTVVIIVLVSMWAALWGVSLTMEIREFHDGGSEAQLWLGCIVGPFGVWVRWWLARLNGRGLGKSGLFKWLPFGTLAANVSAACMMAALATIKKAVDTETSVTVASGIQLGFLGCLSTVSTMMAEFNAMRESSRSWRAYVYVFITIAISFGLGTLIYSVPVWTKGYK